MTVLTRLLHAIDAEDWDVVRACLADELRTDYTSLFGGEAEHLTVDELIGRWRPLMRGLTATHHQTGPVEETGDRLETHVVAHHWLDDAPGGDTWVVYGHYVVTVTDGRIAELTLLTSRQTGNRDLPGLAAAAGEKQALRS